MNRDDFAARTWIHNSVDVDLREDLVLLCRAATRRFALEASAVVRVHGAAQFVPVGGLGACIAGVVNVAGEHLPLVSAALALGEDQSALESAQRFIELRADTRWLLWVDAVDGVLRAPAYQFDALLTPEDAPVRHVLRLERESVALLNLASLEPGAVVTRASP